MAIWGDSNQYFGIYVIVKNITDILLNYQHTDLDDIILKTKQQPHHDGWRPLLLQERRHSMVAGLCSSNHWAGTQPPKCSALELNCNDFILLTSTCNNTWLWWWSLVMKLLICRDWQLTRSKLAGQTPPASCHVKPGVGVEVRWTTPIFIYPCHGTPIW